MMQTIIGWEINEEEKEIIPEDWEYGVLPEEEFECGKLVKGDRIQLEVHLDNGGMVFYDTVVSSVEILISFKENSSVKDVCQWVKLNGELEEGRE